MEYRRVFIVDCVLALGTGVRCLLKFLVGFRPRPRGYFSACIACHGLAVPSFIIQPNNDELFGV